MIIGLSGRIKSGKGYVSDGLINKGFEKVTVASFLKESISKLYDLDIDYFYDQSLKTKELNLPWNKSMAKEFSKITGEDLDKIWLKTDESLVFNNVRFAMQHIGTEVFRRIDKNYHVKKMLSNLDVGKDYVCDDVRFPNEKETLEKYGGKCVYILRSNQWEIYNHTSETSLNWTHFDHLLINNKDLLYLDKKMSSFLSNLIIESQGKKRFSISSGDLKKMLEKHGSTTSVANEIGCSRDKVIWWCNRYLISPPVNKYDFDHRSFLEVNEQSSYFAGLLSADGCVKYNKTGSWIVELTSNDKELVDNFNNYIKTNKPSYVRKRYNGKLHYYSVVNSLFIVENLKLWNIKPRKSKFNEVPEILKRPENNSLIGSWFVGLIDGDGSVAATGPDRIRCLASEQIVDWLCGVYSEFNPKKYSEKNIENLFTINFHGKYARALIDNLPLIGLDRKWSRYK